MQTDSLDKYEKQYLLARRRPPLSSLRAFFWCFLPAIGAATTAMQWVRGIDAGGLVLTAAIFAVMVLAYFPLAAMVARLPGYHVVNWSGIARTVPATTGTASEDFIGETRVILPAGWDDHFRRMSGRNVCAYGVLTAETETPQVQVLSLDGDYFVSREVPVGLTRIGRPHLHYALAVVPLFILLGIAMKTRFYAEYLLFFGLVSAGFAFYGIHVARRNRAIRRDIDQLYRLPQSPA